MSDEQDFCYQIRRYRPGSRVVEFCGCPAADYFHDRFGSSAAKHPFKGTPPRWLKAAERGYSHDWPRLPLPAPHQESRK